MNLPDARKRLPMSSVSTAATAGVRPSSAGLTKRDADVLGVIRCALGSAHGRTPPVAGATHVRAPAGEQARAAASHQGGDRALLDEAHEAAGAHERGVDEAWGQRGSRQAAYVRMGRKHWARRGTQSSTIARLRRADSRLTRREAARGPRCRVPSQSAAPSNDCSTHLGCRTREWGP